MNVSVIKDSVDYMLFGVIIKSDRSVYKHLMLSAKVILERGWVICFGANYKCLQFVGIFNSQFTSVRPWC
jgi:hypothetical protein